MATIPFETSILHNRYARAKGLRFDAPVRRVSWSQLLPPLVLFLVLMLQLSARIAIFAEGYRLEETRKQIMQNDSHLRTLRLAYAQASSTTKLIESAHAKLGLVPTVPQRVRKIPIE